MFKVTIDKTSFTIQFKNQEVILDDVPWSGDLVKVGENLYHLLQDTRSYMVELHSAENRSIQLSINGVKTEALVQDKYDLLLEKLGMQQTNNSHHKEVRAPMPGMILEVMVEKGQKVSKGDKLLILEAMKMENVIKSEGNGTIVEVNIKKGMSVEKNQVLVQF